MFFLQRKGVLTPITSQFLVSKSIETIGDLAYITNTSGCGDIAAAIKLAQAEGLSAIVDTAKGLLTQLSSASSSSRDMPLGAAAVAPKKAPRQLRAQAAKLELTQKNDVLKRTIIAQKLAQESRSWYPVAGIAAGHPESDHVRICQVFVARLLDLQIEVGTMRGVATGNYCGLVSL